MSSPSYNPTAVPVDPVAASLPIEPVPIAAWTPLGRILFRFAFTYLLIYAFGCDNGTLFSLIPFGGGDWLSAHFALLWTKPAERLAGPFFGVTGVGAHAHITGSGDTAINWIAAGLMLLTALIVSVVWSILGRQRSQYRTLAAWLRFLLRLTLVFTLLGYGFDKFFPLQMPPPLLAVLNEPLGQSSPMTLLWTTLGLNPLYESICGVAEISAALLLLFRRTALAGGLLAGFVMCNVLLYNVFFDVPVKLYSAHLLLFSIAVVVPDLQALFNFFWKHKPAAPSGVWVPPASRRPFRIATLAVECILLALFVCFHIPPLYGAMVAHRASVLHPSPYTGEWHIDSAIHSVNGVTVSQPLFTGDGQPATELFLEPNGSAEVRSSDGALWRTSVAINAAKHTVAISSYAYRGGDYTFSQPDASHLILVPSGKDAPARGTIYLTRILLPASYPLLTRHRHWVNEWGLER
jgi:hypothetical protein